MTAVAVVGYAAEISHRDVGASDAELLGPVIERALQDSGLRREDVGVVCSAGFEFASGIVGSMMDVFDVLPCWPPAIHTHLEGDGAFALQEAWVRLLAGEAEVALVCAYSRPLARDLPAVMSLQLDPYLVGPLGPRDHHIAALAARSLIETGRYGEDDFAAVVGRSRGMSLGDALAQPYLASPLRVTDCSTTSCSGVAAVVLAVRERTGTVARPAWIRGIDQRVESSALGARDLTRSVSVEASAQALGIRGSVVDVLEVHTPFSYGELIVVDAIGAAQIGALNPSGGVLPADPVGVSGLIRIGAAAQAVMQGRADTAVAHATNGPALQHNLLCSLGGDS